MKQLRGWKELAFILIVAIGSAIFVRSYFLVPFRVQTNSMLPTLLPGDFIFVSRVAYGFPGIDSDPLFQKVPARGDLVSHISENNPEKVYLKRVIGLPGDRVELKKNRLYVNGGPFSYRALGDGTSEIYTESFEGKSWKIRWNSKLLSANQKALIVPPGRVFLLSDNRVEEDDSSWGTVPSSVIVGKVAMIWLSLDWQKKNASQAWPSLRWERIFFRVH